MTSNRWVFQAVTAVAVLVMALAACSVVFADPSAPTCGAPCRGVDTGDHWDDHTTRSGIRTPLKTKSAPPARRTTPRTVTGKRSR